MLRNWIVRPLAVLLAIIALTMPLRRATIDREGFWRNPTLLDLLVWPADASYRASIIKSWQSGSVTITTTTGTATITAVTVANTLLIMNGYTAASAPGDASVGPLFPNLVLTNTTTVTGTRGVNSGHNLVVGFNAMEFYPNVLTANGVQRFTITLLANATSNTQTITAVGSKAALVMNGFYATAGTFGVQDNDELFPTGVLTNPTTVTMSRFAQTNTEQLVGSFQVIDPR